MEDFVQMTSINTNVCAHQTLKGSIVKLLSKIFVQITLVLMEERALDLEINVGIILVLVLLILLEETVQ